MRRANGNCGPNDRRGQSGTAGDRTIICLTVPSAFDRASLVVRQNCVRRLVGQHITLALEELARVLSKMREIGAEIQLDDPPAARGAQEEGFSSLREVLKGCQRAIRTSDSRSIMSVPETLQRLRSVLEVQNMRRWPPCTAFNLRAAG